MSQMGKMMAWGVVRVPVYARGISCPSKEGLVRSDGLVVTDGQAAGIIPQHGFRRISFEASRVFAANLRQSQAATTELRASTNKAIASERCAGRGQRRSLPRRA